ncbi:MAG: acyltransferase domain-containing protein [Propionibacteriaceae bacterium]|nr:acyltransferase domain-containing protein [Propionibacteriaceae bacterium]
MLAIVAPGQGAQTPGFLTPWLEIRTFADRLTWLSAVAGLDLAYYGTEADAEQIRDTAITQPLLVASAMLTALELFGSPSGAYGKVGVVAGHSVGEIAAAAGAGVLSAEAAMVFVRERGRLMAEAASVQATSMTAVIGGDRDEVLAAIEAAGLTPANNNGAGQIVAGGTLEQLAALAANPPRRARLIPLSVAGAFHTVHMEPAVAHLGRLAQAISTRSPRMMLLSNADGAVVGRGRDYLDRLVSQVASPVRWDLCMQTMADLGVTGLLELPPAGTLTGIAKRNLKGVELFSLNTPDQLEDARAFVAAHADGLADTPSRRMLMAPGRGQFRAEQLDAGTVLPPGAHVGAVHGLCETMPVVAPHGGSVAEWLAGDGDLVNPGQPVLRLHPSADFSLED